MLDKDKQLTKLLKMRAEMPSKEEWASFDRSLANKMLSSVKISWFERVRLLLSQQSMDYRTAFAFCALLLLLLFVKPANIATQKNLSMPPAKFAAQKIEFATDKIFSNANEAEFRACDIEYFCDGVEYINDVISAKQGSNLLAKM